MKQVLNHFFRILLLGSFLSACVTAEEARKADALRELGVSYINEGSTEDALRELEKARDLDPRDAETRHALGLAFFAKGLLDKAEKEFLTAVKLDPQLTEARLNLGSLYIAQERYEESIPCFKAVVEDYLYRSPARAYNNMGWAYFKLGKTEEALDAYRQALRIAPMFCQAHYNLALLYEAGSDLEKAASSLEEAVRYCPDDLRFRLTLGMLQVRLDRRGEAMDNLQRVASSDPNGDLGAAAREQLRALQ